MKNEKKIQNLKNSKIICPIVCTVVPVPLVSMSFVMTILNKSKQQTNNYNSLEFEEQILWDICFC